eukprot:75049-Chlamydomonas_euryale.AAC.2
MPPHSCGRRVPRRGRPGRSGRRAWRARPTAARPRTMHACMPVRMRRCGRVAAMCPAPALVRNTGRAVGYVRTILPSHQPTCAAGEHLNKARARPAQATSLVRTRRAHASDASWCASRAVCRTVAAARARLRLRSSFCRAASGRPRCSPTACFSCGCSSCLEPEPGGLERASPRLALAPRPRARSQGTLATRASAALGTACASAGRLPGRAKAAGSSGPD